MLALEQLQLLPLQSEEFELAEEHFRRVNDKGCVQAGNNFYSTALLTASYRLNRGGKPLLKIIQTFILSAASNPEQGGV